MICILEWKCLERPWDSRIEDLFHWEVDEKVRQKENTFECEV